MGRTLSKSQVNTSSLQEAELKSKQLATEICFKKRELQQQRASWSEKPSVSILEPPIHVWGSSSTERLKSLPMTRATGERAMTRDNHKLGEFSLTGIPPAPRGTPKIEVTFDIDANGILNVSASDKSTGKAEKITITNDKGRLSKEDIDKMVNDAEQFKAEDAKQRERIDAKNGLESYCFNIKSTVEDSNMKDKIAESDRSSILQRVDETIAWLDRNQTAEVDEFKDKQKELEAVCNPVIQKMYAQAGGSQPSGGAQSCGSQSGQTFNQGPTVEEVD